MYFVVNLLSQMCWQNKLFLAFTCIFHFSNLYLHNIRNRIMRHITDVFENPIAYITCLSDSWCLTFEGAITEPPFS